MHDEKKASKMRSEPAHACRLAQSRLYAAARNRIVPCKGWPLLENIKIDKKCAVQKQALVPDSIILSNMLPPGACSSTRHLQ